MCLVSFICWCGCVKLKKNIRRVYAYFLSAEKFLHSTCECVCEGERKSVCVFVCVRYLTSTYASFINKIGKEFRALSFVLESKLTLLAKTAKYF